MTIEEILLTFFGLSTLKDRKGREATFPMYDARTFRGSQRKNYKSRREKMLLKEDDEMSVVIFADTLDSDWRN